MRLKVSIVLILNQNLNINLESKKLSFYKMARVLLFLIAI
jgi:hypothetical protein